MRTATDSMACWWDSAGVTRSGSAAHAVTSPVGVELEQLGWSQATCRLGHKRALCITSLRGQ